MNKRAGQILVVIFLLLLFLGGCRSLTSEPLRICPGKNNSAEAIALLKARTENITAIKANGLCKLKFHNDVGKEFKEAFPVRLWVEPSGQICLHANMLFNPAAIIAGANENEFWLYSALMKSYAWGQFNTDGSITFAKDVPSILLSLSPQFLFDAMGLIKIDDSSNWTLQNAGAFDILEKYTADGKITKRIYVNCCDYTIRTIEYLDRSGKVTAFIELDDYKTIAAGINVPGKIAVVQTGVDGELTSATIELNKIALTELSAKQRQAFFTRPKPDGFENVRKITE